MSLNNPPANAPPAFPPGTVWQPQEGGTGHANASSVTWSGFDLILGMTAATTVFLPPAGTLATLAGEETLANKTLDSVVRAIWRRGPPGQDVVAEWVSASLPISTMRWVNENGGTYYV